MKIKLNNKNLESSKKKKNLNSYFLIHNTNAGFVAFSSLLIVSAVVLATAFSISLLSIGQANSALGFMKGQEALKIAESCGEEAMLRLRNDAQYTGGILTIGTGSCTILVSGSGSNKLIDITGTITGPPQFVRKLQINAKRTGNSINIINWTQVE